MDPANLVKNRQQASYLGELTREEAWCTLALGGPRSIQAASVTAFPLLSSPTITVDGFRLSSLPLTLQPLCLSALSLDQFPEWGQLGSSLSLHQFLSPGREWSGFSISLSHQFPTHPTLSNLVLLQKSQHHLVLVLNPSQRSPHGLVLNPVQSPKDASTWAWAGGSCLVRARSVRSVVRSCSFQAHHQPSGQASHVASIVSHWSATFRTAHSLFLIWTKLRTELTNIDLKKPRLSVKELMWVKWHKYGFKTKPELEKGREFYFCFLSACFI